MKIVSFLCTYNDCEYLNESIESFKWFCDKLFIVEGSWQSSQKFKTSGPRSNQQTYDIINKHVDNNKVFLVQANELREREQRQIGLELAKKEKADWCFMLDSDEIYKKSTLLGIKSILQKNTENKNVLGFRLKSFNFINSFLKYYNGDYMRIYRVTPQASFFMDNDVEWPDSQGTILNIPDNLKFFHYNYVKQNSEQFWRKLFYQNEQDPSFNDRVRPQYNYDDLKKQYKIPDGCKIFDYVGSHPKIMTNHPYILENIFLDKEIKFGNQ